MNSYHHSLDSLRQAEIRALKWNASQLWTRISIICSLLNFSLLTHRSDCDKKPLYLLMGLWIHILFYKICCHIFLDMAKFFQFWWSYKLKLATFLSKVKVLECFRNFWNHSVCQKTFKNIKLETHFSPTH